MSKQNSIMQQAPNHQFGLIELSERQLDNVAGGTKTTDHASPDLSAQYCSGKHFPNAVITVRWQYIRIISSKSPRFLRGDLNNFALGV